MFDFLTPDKASLIAQKAHAFSMLLAVMGLVIVALIFASIIHSAFEYRSASDADRSRQIADTDRAQIGRILIIFIVLLLVFALGTSLYLSAISPPPPNAIEIAAVGKRWMWKFQHYPDGQREINELHLPTDRPIKLTITSQDVMHSLSIPALGLQQSALPGHYTTAWLEVSAIITKAGDYKAYRLMGGQYNGTAYSQMVGKLIALSPDDYQLWLEGEYIPGGREATPVEKGQALFEKNGCPGCHLATGEGPAPWFAGRYGQTINLEGGETVAVDDNYLRESIIEPGAKIVASYTTTLMPPYANVFSEEELANLIAYIKSLSGVFEGAAVPAEMPEAYTTLGCVGCHGLNLEGGTGPILVGLNVDYIMKEARAGNEELGMTPYGPDLIKDGELEQIALFINAATMEYTGLELSEGLLEKLQLLREPLAAEDKEGVEAALTKALEATIINKSPLSVQNTLKAMITNLELDNWAEYTGWRLTALLGEEEDAGDATPAEKGTVEPEPTPTPTNKAAATASPSPAPEPTPTPTNKAAATASPSPAPEPTPTPTDKAVEARSTSDAAETASANEAAEAPSTAAATIEAAAATPTSGAAAAGGSAGELTIIFPAPKADIIVGRLSVIGSSAAGTYIEIADNGTVVGSAVSDINGEWIFPLILEQKGAHQLTAQPAGAGAGAALSVNVVAAGSQNCASNPAIKREGGYIVGDCDTLKSISASAGISFETLLAANPQIENPDLIYPGDIISLPR